jgi:hypothetical protein
MDGSSDSQIKILATTRRLLNPPSNKASSSAAAAIGKKRCLDACRSGIKFKGQITTTTITTTTLETLPVSADFRSSSPPQKKTTKPSNFPRRALSAYNIFFSMERERLLAELKSNDCINSNSNDGGDHADSPAKGVDTNTGDQESTNKAPPKASLPAILLRPLVKSPTERRKHRKTHGKISLADLANTIGRRWKALSEEKRKYCRDLAKEDVERHEIAVEEYYLQNPDCAP